MQLLYDVALQMLNIPYKWGGKCPLDGLDCSGLVEVLLRSQGVTFPDDQNAQEYFDYFSQPANHLSQDPQLGALCFYGKDPKSVHHISMALDPFRQIEASGGTQTTINLAEAIRLRAYVKVTPIRFQSDFRGCFVPDYEYFPYK